MMPQTDRRLQAASTLAAREAAHATLLAISHTLPTDARTREAYFWLFLTADEPCRSLREWRALEARAAQRGETIAEALDAAMVHALAVAAEAAAQAQIGVTR